MTALADRLYRTLTDSFEEAARIVGRAEEGVRLELVGGKTRSRAAPDGDRGLITEWLTRICLQHRPALWLNPGQGLRVEAYRGGRARPDGSLASSEAFVGQGEWADPDPVLMVVGVTSHDFDTERRDRMEKPRAYAETGIPLSLLIDRAACEVTVYSEPDGARHADAHTVPLGKTLRLPDPVNITLETEPLKDWVD
ncbi:Uma2 family endonuclease [Streptomyces pinistramenti]|uniref:Uma2 family endonuclease n=1 Tax=Streptomyces pinistramenti TaxID=2884812 RepID=UPI001D07F658|nr:Uma2 family endonuclease [Streptomyces pinistramenti]MCB5908759.1 Uma2 family endonuclease [Streptomyces pinistramenti]